MRKIYLLMLFVGSLTPALLAQDLQFTQAYASPLQLNPAMSGYFHPSTPVRFAAVYRNQWPGAAARYETIYAGVDVSLLDKPKRRRGGSRSLLQTVRPVGMGLMVMSDRAGQANLRATQAALQYALEITLSERRSNRNAQGVYLRVGFQGGVVARDLDYSRLVFEEDLRVPGSAEVISGQSHVYADFATGALLYTKRLWLGVGVHHLTTPNESGTFEGSSPLPRRWTLHGGYQIPLESVRGSERLSRSLTPVVTWRRQGAFEQLDVGASMYVHPLVFGAFYRGLPLRQSVAGVVNQDALSALMGLQFSNFSFAYSYDFTLSALSATGGGAHEISLTYKMPAIRRRSLRRDFPCLYF